MPHAFITENTKPQVVVIGSFQCGKSTLINGLVGHNVAEIGDGVATTKSCTRYRANPKNGYTEAVSHTGKVFYTWPEVTAQILEHVDLIDTPGFGAGGPDSPACESAASEALATANVVLFVANQTGLGGVAERRILGCINQHSAVVITLQNVFVPSSTAKKATWLALLEKQVADIGVSAWCLQPNTRALSINALQLAERVNTNRMTNLETAYRGVNDKPQHLDDSGVDPLIAFLESRNSIKLGATELFLLHRASDNWVHRRTQKLVHHLEEFFKPCL